MIDSGETKLEILSLVADWFDINPYLSGAPRIEVLECDTGGNIETEDVDEPEADSEGDDEVDKLDGESPEALPFTDQHARGIPTDIIKKALGHGSVVFSHVELARRHPRQTRAAPEPSREPNAHSISDSYVIQTRPPGYDTDSDYIVPRQSGPDSNSDHQPSAGASISHADSDPPPDVSSEEEFAIMKPIESDFARFREPSPEHNLSGHTFSDGSPVSRALVPALPEVWGIFGCS